jgi:lipoprotein-anchoring transpeptidase ErfK/SrfK
VRRAGFAVLFFIACALAGGLSAAALTSSGAASPGQTTSSTSSSTTTTTTPTTTTPAALPHGVTIAGIPVGGLSPEDAYALVREAFERPLVLVVAGHRLAPTPEQLGAVAYALGAVERARTALSGTDVPLRIAVDGRRVRAYVATLAKRFDRVPVDSRLFLRRLRPWISKDRAGRTIARTAATQALVWALLANRKGPLTLKATATGAKVSRRKFGPVIVIRRGSNRLFLYSGMRFLRSFGVATGQSVYPTPLGRFRVVVKWKNPWWHPPNSDWARGQQPIPPGPGNPLGTRWMGLSASGVGIHGTPDPASIGYSVSHGCIRMRIPEAEWLFEHVRVGTTVFIVSA